MKIDRSVTKQIEESKYLATENSMRYRIIIRIMFKGYECMRYSFYKEDIYDGLKKYDEFEEYTMEQLKCDLDQLTKWKNLGSVADASKVNTIEEFKNREFRYNLSQTTLEFERMLIKLENMNIENSSTLESSLVEKFRDLIEKFNDMKNEDDKVTYDWFKELNMSFQNLNINYQDYISKFYSPKTDELMKTTEFLVYKENFIKYLREFIKTLQINTSIIKQIFRNIEDDAVNKIINKMLKYEKEIQNLDLKIDNLEYQDLNKGRINSMKEWFIGSFGREPLIEQLISNTNEIIRKITRYAAIIADKKCNNANRKEEYNRIGAFFKECKELDEAHKISSVIFGSLAVMKIIVNENRVTESINSSIYDEGATEIIIKPRIRTYREKIIKNPIKNKSAIKKKKLEKVLKRRENEQILINKYIKDNVIDFKKLPEISTLDRTVLLKLLVKGRNNKRKWSVGEHGIEYRVILEDGTNIHLKCEDGSLYMPPYKIVFKESI